MVKIDAGGNLFWQKTFVSTSWRQSAASGGTDVYDCTQDANGNVYLCGNMFYQSPARYAFVLKMDTGSNNVYPLPSFSLGNNAALCAGQKPHVYETPFHLEKV